MKQILLQHGGIRSTVERRYFWIFNTKITKLKAEHGGPDFYETLLQNLDPESRDGNIAFEISKDIGRTFPELQFFRQNQPGSTKLMQILQAVSCY